MSERWWQDKTLDEMTREEWESLCDGCGRCCLIKLTDEDTGRIHTTTVACKLLDVRSCRCSDYAHRLTRVPHCLQITPERAHSLSWLPTTCAYRRLAHGQDLPDWHPLLSGDPESVHRAGISMRGRALSERHIDPVLFEMFVIEA